MKIPLAWLQLTREKMRLLVALAGIGFADILMFMQLGFRDALFDSSVRVHSNLDGDIFLVSPQSTTLTAMKSFPQRRLYQTLAFEGVESVKPVYLDFALWKNPVDRSTRGIFVLAFDPDDSVFNLPGVVDNINQVKLTDKVLFDAASRDEFGPVAEKFNQGESVTTEVGGRRVEVRGLFEMGASFGANGNILTSDLNFLRMFPNRKKGIIDVGIVKLKPAADVEDVLKQMKTYLPADVRYFSKQEFMAWEKKYWQTSTTIGFIFSLGTAMGFIVGIVIVYQILYTDVSDHLAEYATLKAMGYKDIYFLIVVFQEALILAILGYIPGCAVAIGLYNLTKNATSLPMIMTLARATTVLILTMVMCSVSGAIAVRKLNAADPADIF
ncbi:ABC transporter permease DevC [Microcoleus sp. FACHB-672]|uniref:ABC transporter permease DevC n=1 Tax=Microcoleus sp. FACHB-672 TaxID=2692825 RepID=UPI0016883C36|nr:ABC transporter permease DevC [Microcoleus sp. FACHB-672]MBD2041283.1 FtsX-like permease family protein [Microcoleus sp. FACHB-672]